MRDAVQALPVHRHDLVAPLQPPVLGGGALSAETRLNVCALAKAAFFSAHLSEHGLDVDGQVSVGAAVPAHDAEAQPVRAPPEGDALVLGGAETHTLASA